MKPLFQSEAKCEAIDMKMICYSHTLKHKKGFCTQPCLESESFWNSEMTYLLDFVRIGKVLFAARMAQLGSARPSEREVPSSIPDDITSLFQLLSFLSSFD